MKQTMKEIGFKFTFDEASEKSVDYFGDKLDDKVKESIISHMDVDVDKIYSEWAKPYGHSPYMKIHVNVKSDQEQDMILEMLNIVLSENVDVEIVDTHSARYH